MPSTDPPADVSLEADLRFEVSSAAGTTTAHLSGHDDDLVLDVEDPVALARRLPLSRALAGMGRTVVPPELWGRDVRVVSRGRDLGRVGTSASGRLRLRPSPAGVRPAVAVLRQTRPGALAVPAGVVAVLACVVALAIRRRTVRPTVAP